ncbi:MAG TPA: hypothetical protein VFG15_30200 [Amycolatopsis sp.]|nr:hypothetical protein [Amycolatopsis sp.]
MPEFPTSTYGVTPDVTVSWIANADDDTLARCARALVTALLEGPDPDDDPETAELTMRLYRRGLATVVNAIHGRALLDVEGVDQ